MENSQALSDAKRKPDSWGRDSLRINGRILFFAACVFLPIYCCLGPIVTPVHHPMHNAWMQQTRAIGLVLISYAQDHQGKFPDGKSSTEIFQQLLDQQYIMDPAIFWIRMDGKVRSDENQRRLRPENVCFDITGGMDEGDSDSLPLVFLTGYRVTYAPGGSAVPATGSFPPYRSSDSVFAGSDPNQIGRAHV